MNRKRKVERPSGNPHDDKDERQSRIQRMRKHQSPAPRMRRNNEKRMMPQRTTDTLLRTVRTSDENTMGTPLSFSNERRAAPSRRLKNETTTPRNQVRSEERRVGKEWRSR